MAEGAERHQRSHADEYELIVNGIKDERDLARQIALVEEKTAHGVDAIVIAPADSKALAPVLKRAQDAGVVVVNIDNKLDEGVLQEVGARIPFVGPNNRAGARQVGDYLAGRLRPGDQVAVLEGIRTSYNSQQRKLGFEESLRGAVAEFVTSQSGQWEMSVANQLTSAILGEYPDLRAIVGCNDNMALGALAAVRAARGPDPPLIVGYDNITSVRQAIRDGRILATADQHADQLAVFGIEFALRLLTKAEVPEDKDTPVDLVTVDTLK